MAMNSSAPTCREGDWRCDGCQNKNYAFRSFCNRCKQPRLLVDSKTPSDSKWLPRIGDWICAGCSNNNYASREKCNKCGTPKEFAALPAMALPGAAMAAPTFTYDSLRGSGGLGLGLNSGTTLLHRSQSSWPFSSSTLLGGGGTLGGNNLSWRQGDWVCMCGFHNYSSRSMCKQCQRSMQASNLSSALQPGLSLSASSLSLLQAASAMSGVGIKRSAIDDMGNDLKRFHGTDYTTFQNQLSTLGILPLSGSSLEIAESSNGSLSNSQLQPPTQIPGLTLIPAIVGKGAKQWRSGDWMCGGCNNHNFASRETCNRCGGKRDSMSQILSVA